MSYTADHASSSGYNFSTITISLQGVGVDLVFQWQNSIVTLSVVYDSLMHLRNLGIIRPTRAAII